MNAAVDSPLTSPQGSAGDPVVIVEQHSERRKWYIRFWLCVAMLALCLIGLALTDYDQIQAEIYWTVMIPVFGIISVILTATHHRGTSKSFWKMVGRQALHWLALLLAVRLMIILQEQGNMNRNEAGFSILAVISLATFMAGIHFDWMFMIIGAFLGVVTIAISTIQEYEWMVIWGLALLAVVAIYGRRWFGKKVRNRETAAT